MWTATAFYAAVEMQRRPELRDKPVAVCGSQEERHGIVLTANYLAKPRGVKTGQVNLCLASHKMAYEKKDIMRRLFDIFNYNQGYNNPFFA